MSVLNISLFCVTGKRGWIRVGSSKKEIDLLTSLGFGSAKKPPFFSVYEINKLNEQ